MTQATSTVGQSMPCIGGPCKHQIRTWTDDGEINVQLETRNGVVLAQAKFTGRDAEDMAIMVATKWVTHA